MDRRALDELPMESEVSSFRSRYLVIENDMHFVKKHEAGKLHGVVGSFVTED